MKIPPILLLQFFFLCRWFLSASRWCFPLLGRFFKPIRDFTPLCFFLSERSGKDDIWWELPLSLTFQLSSTLINFEPVQILIRVDEILLVSLENISNLQVNFLSTIWLFISGVINSFWDWMPVQAVIRWKKF